jgi:hypothetical protein
MCQMKSTMSAPTIAPIRPAPSPGRYHPSAWPTLVATKAPMMPRVAVRMKPPGLFGPRRDELRDHARDEADA